MNLVEAYKLLADSFNDTKEKTDLVRWLYDNNFEIVDRSLPEDYIRAVEKEYRGEF